MKNEFLLFSFKFFVFLLSPVKAPSDFTPDSLHLNLDIFSDCLIQLINYRGINILIPPRIPVIYSRYKVIKDVGHNGNLKFLRHEFQNTTGESSHGEIDKMERDFTTTSKNWYCTSSFYIFPPISSKPKNSDKHNEWIHYKNDTGHLHDMLAIPHSYINYGIYKPPYDSKTTNFFQRKPHQAYSILIMMMSPRNNLEESMEERISPWKHTFYSLLNQNEKQQHKFRYHTDLLLFGTAVSNKSSNLLVPISTAKYYMWHLCRHCDPCYSFIPVLLPPIKTRAFLDSILTLHKTSPTLWILMHPNDAEWSGNNSKRFQDLKGHRLYFPKDGSNQVEPWDTSFALSYLNQPLSNIIFGNHSFTSFNSLKFIDSPCTSYVSQHIAILPTIVYTEAPQTDFLLPEELHPFRFVSCGGKPRTKNVLSFSSFYSAYDISTWCIIFFFYFFIHALLNPSMKLQDTFFSGYSILVEQSQRSSSQLGNKLSHLFLYGTLIVPGIVLSNAYKGENITRLTLPIEPLPYETLQELLLNNFTLYQNSDRINNLEWSFKVTMPPMMTADAERKLLEKVETMNKSLILEKLIVCGEDKGIALLEPEGGVFNHASMLRNYAHIEWEDVGVGKELFSGVWRGLKILNNVDPKIAERVMRFVETGISTQWLDMWSRRLVLQGEAWSAHYAKNELERKAIEKRNRKKKYVWKTSMVLNGSILTLFVVLGGCQMVATGCFFLELIEYKIASQKI